MNRIDKLYSREMIHAIRRKYGFEVSKKLGQNFIMDGDVIDDIVCGSDAEGAVVVEIGPGIGTLTRAIAQEAERVIAVELDPRLIPILQDTLGDLDNLTLINGDVLKVDLQEVISDAKRAGGAAKARIIGNLPYYITTPIIMKLLSKDTGADSITAMMQKEVAERLLAEPGTKKCGAISYAVSYRCRAAKIRDVDRNCFYPAPKVDSTIIRLDFRDEPAVAAVNEALFFRCIRAGFSQRRKTLRNSLQSMQGYDRQAIDEALGAAGIDGKRRAETLSLQEFADLTKGLERADKWKK